MHAGGCDNSTDSKLVVPRHAVLELALPQFKAMRILGQFCMRQISRRIRFIASETFSLLASVYVVSRGVQYAKERCPVTSLRMRIHRILFLASSKR